MNKNAQDKGLYAWIVGHVNAPYAMQLFFLLFALEAVLLVPLDPILAFFVTHRRDDAYRFALIATIGSVLGSLLGYALGSILWDTIGNKIVLWFVKQSSFDWFTAYYQSHYKAALFFGALFPFPFKVLTLSAGFCKLPLVSFTGIIAAARAFRFFLICYVSREWGGVIQNFVRQYSGHLLLLLAIKIVLVLVCYMIFFR